jgi:hypothetical protein
MGGRRFRFRIAASLFEPTSDETAPRFDSDCIGIDRFAKCEKPLKRREIQAFKATAADGCGFESYPPL